MALWNWLLRMLSGEHFRVAGRTKWYEILDEMQTDLDAFLKPCNQERSHQGCIMKGRIPYQVFVDGVVKPKSEETEAKEAS